MFDVTPVRRAPAWSADPAWRMGLAPGLPPDEPVLPSAPEIGGDSPVVLAAEPDEEFDENDFDDDFDDDFEEELDDELNDDLDEFDEQVEGDEDLGDGDPDPDEVPFEEEEDF